MRPCDASVLGRIRSAGRPVVIFGAGDLGKLALHALVAHGVTVARFYDNNPRKDGTTWKGVEVVSADRLAEISSDTHVFVASNYLEPMELFLDGLGFTDVHHCAELLREADFSDADLGMSPVFIDRKVTLHVAEAAKAEDHRTSRLFLKYLDVVITEACSMKCQDCSNLMQYYARPQHSDIDLLSSALAQIMASIDGISEFRVLGGEPFVNRKMHLVIDQLTAYDHVDRVVVYTNGTIVPRAENLDCLRHEKVTIDVTNYGEHSKKHKQLLTTLTANGISFTTKIPEWTDSGRINFIDRPSEELDRMFTNCCVNDVLTLLNGKLYRCPFSANGTNLGAIPEHEDNIVDLRAAVAPDLLRRQIERLYGKDTHLTACSYCNGRDYSTPRIQAGLQIRRPLALPTR